MDKFAAFILTHGRPDNVRTYKELRKCGYTGRIVLLVDDQDDTLNEYRKLYGDEVEVFDKIAVSKKIDRGDNFERLDSVVFARRACFDVAKSLGLSHFVQLDDDYTHFGYRFDEQFYYAGCPSIRSMDTVFQALCRFIDRTGVKTIAMAQGGDFIGGPNGTSRFVKDIHAPRKAMNSFFCRTDNPINWVARMNDDVTTYVVNGIRGEIFLTTNQVSLDQGKTQHNSGGLTDMYLAFGTYAKSFYSVMYHPAAVTVKLLNSRSNPRLHHQVYWRSTTPMIVRETVRKTEA